MHTNAIKKLHVALFAGVTALFVAAPAAEAAIVYTNLTATPLAITNSIDGIYLNIVTGVSGASAAAVPGWDIDPYNNGVSLTFYGAASPSGILTSLAAGGPTGTSAAALSLPAGSLISAAGTYNQFQTTGANFVGTSGTQYVGFRFLNEGTSTTNYAWLSVVTTAGTGFPASITGYAYENTGLSILAGQTVTPVPEASTFAMLGLGLAGVGAVARRRRRPA